jgi:glycogen debranching enzyme
MLRPNQLLAVSLYRVHGDREAARRLLMPLAHHVADHGVGRIAELFEGDPPFRPDGGPAQA